MYIRDWRIALRSPPTYRIGNRTFRFQVHFIWIIFCFIGAVGVIFYVLKNDAQSSFLRNTIQNAPCLTDAHTPSYNFTYPLSSPIISSGIQSFRIGIIADLDTNSKVSEYIWKSYLKKGYLVYSPASKKIVIKWDSDEPIELKSSYSLKGRGMELSELVIFNGKLLSFDDRTGIIYEIHKDKVVPWVLLVDGDGQGSKGFKSEWATVKDQVLYVGSMGKEWTTDVGEFENNDPMYVKAVNLNGQVRHLNWVNNFKEIRSIMGISWPGYMIHESGAWSNEHKKWYFLPRRCSKEKYNDTKDEHMGCNVLISADENFSNVQKTEIGILKPTHGFSSFKFLPGTNDNIIVALKTEEINGKTATYITVFTITGEILLADDKIPTDYKFEGFEFI